MNEQETQQRVEQAKANLIARAEELSRRVQDAKHKLDIPAKIAENPQLAAGIALAAGALLAFLVGGPRPRPRVIVKHTGSAAPEQAAKKAGLMSAAGAMLGTLALRFAKDYAMSHIVDKAKSWIDENQRMAGTEARASRVPETEQFLRH